MSCQEVAITILFETLQVHKPDPPSPTPKGFTAFIERECVRRCFWLIFVADVICTAATRNPKRFPSDNIPIQLPIDETGFEFGIQDRIPGDLCLFPVVLVVD
jgi:Fungal specific transcription factor domain